MCIKVPSCTTSAAAAASTTAQAASARKTFELHPFVFFILVAAALLARTYLRTREELADSSVDWTPSSQTIAERRRKRGNAGAAGTQTSGIGTKQGLPFDDEAMEEVGFLVSVHTRSRSTSSMGLDTGLRYSRDEFPSAGWSETQSRDDGGDTGRFNMQTSQQQQQHGGCSFDEVSFRKIGGYRHTYGYGMARSGLRIASHDTPSPLPPLPLAQYTQQSNDAELTQEMSQPTEEADQADGRRISPAKV